MEKVGKNALLNYYFSPNQGNCIILIDIICIHRYIFCIPQISNFTKNIINLCHFPDLSFFQLNFCFATFSSQRKKYKEVKSTQVVKPNTKLSVPITKAALMSRKGITA